MRRQPAKALLIDFDGVLRRWDPSVAAGVEAVHGLAPGALLDTAFEWHLLRAAVAGEMTHAAVDGRRRRAARGSREDPDRDDPPCRATSGGGHDRPRHGHRGGRAVAGRPGIRGHRGARPRPRACGPPDCRSGSPPTPPTGSTPTWTPSAWSGRSTPSSTHRRSASTSPLRSSSTAPARRSAPRRRGRCSSTTRTASSGPPGPPSCSRTGGPVPAGCRTCGPHSIRDAGTS